MGNRKNIKVNREFIELLKAHFELDQRQVPIELRNRSWSIRFAARIHIFIHKELERFDFNLTEDAKARFEGRWPESRTIYRAFIKDFTANPDLIQICGWYMFGEEWPIVAIRFQAQEDQQIEYNIEQILKVRYLQDSMFNSIRIPGDKSGYFGQLDMDSYYANLSYIEQKELTDRNTLIRKEQESLRRRFTHVRTDFLHLGTDYLSADIIQNNQRILITGNPGVGKSTYARWLCFKWAKNHLFVPQIPLYIQLRDLNFSNKSTNVISKYIHQHYLNELSLEEVEILLTKEYSKHLLILDGYDELNRKKQIKLEHDLRSLTRPIDQARYIVLSRPYGLIYHKFDKEIVLQIDGFTESSIENYIQAFLTQNPKEHKQKKQLLKLIEQNYILQEHAHNPLMLSYIVLIYTKSKQPEIQLFSIKSTYDLQASVFRWLIDYSMGHEQLIKANENWQKMAGQLAYEMLMAKEFSFKSSIDNLPFTRDQALQFSKLGIGNIIDDDNDYNWRFSFITVTLQEFLASHYLLARITADAFVYLVQDQYHWNFAKMLLGAMQQESARHEVIPFIFQRLEKEYMA
ncbi:MAG: NACHT domain-containing protein, partial [Bacteroidota bacterium]